MRPIPMLILLLAMARLAGAVEPTSIQIDAVAVEAPVGTVLSAGPEQWATVPGLTVLGQPQFLCELGKEAVLDTLVPTTVKPAGLGRVLTEKTGYMLMLVPERMGDRIVYRGRAEASQVHKLVNGENPGILEIAKRECHFAGDAALSTPVWLVTPAVDPERRVHVRLTFQNPPAPSALPSTLPATPSPAPPAP